MKQRAVFIDRDGTINVDVIYMHRVGDIRYYPGVLKGIAHLKKAGFKIIIITNQSAVARGIITEKKLAQIHARIKRDIEKAGGTVDGIYYCPHMPDAGCACRKPGTLMLETAAKEHKIELARSYFIGDRMLDVEAGKKMGMKAVLVPEKGHEKDVLAQQKKSKAKPDYKCGDFGEAADWVLGDSSHI